MGRPRAKAGQGSHRTRRPLPALRGSRGPDPDRCPAPRALAPRCAFASGARTSSPTLALPRPSPGLQPGRLGSRARGGLQGDGSAPWGRRLDAVGGPSEVAVDSGDRESWLFILSWCGWGWWLMWTRRTRSLAPGGPVDYLQRGQGVNPRRSAYHWPGYGRAHAVAWRPRRDLRALPSARNRQIPRRPPRLTAIDATAHRRTGQGLWS
jgi:hypothetical protein